MKAKSLPTEAEYDTEREEEFCLATSILPEAPLQSIRGQPSNPNQVLFQLTTGSTQPRAIVTSHATVLLGCISPVSRTKKAVARPLWTRQALSEARG